MLLMLFMLSLMGGFCSGLLGVGGAVLLIPLLLAVPPLAGVGSLSMHEVSGITMLQVFAASATGYLAHRRSGFVHPATVLSVGLPMGLFSFAGAAASRWMSGRTLLFLFGILVALAFLMLLQPTADEHGGAVAYSCRRVRSAVCGGTVGLLSGIVGAGGGFILIPVMVRILAAPMRIAVGSSLGIVFLGALMGSAGKLVTLQVPWRFLLPVVAGSLPSALAGARISHRISPTRLRQVLLVLVLLIFLKTWYDLLWGRPGCRPAKGRDKAVARMRSFCPPQSAMPPVRSAILPRSVALRPSRRNA